MQQLDVYYQHFFNMFRASLCPSSGEQDVCYCMWCAALVLLDVVGSGCGALRCRVCSNTRLVLLKMGIMMPETCWEIVKNKPLTVASCWFSLSLHDLLTMHGHRNLKLMLCSIIFFPKNPAACKIIWRNVVEPGRPRMTIWRTRIARWIPKATNMHSDYVSLIAFPLQQWLHERAPIFIYN